MRWLHGALGLLLLVLALLSLTIGPAPLTPLEVITALFGQGSVEQVLIVQQLRLPRVIMAWLVGLSLGLSGAALQGLVRNPLAEPGLLGISSSAGLGAVLALYFGITSLSIWLLPAAAMGCALLATLALSLLTWRGASNLTLILAGVALSALAGALTSLALNLAPHPAAAQDMLLWLLGSISERSMNDILLALPFVAVGAALLLSTGAALEVLTLGEAEASSLGVALSQVRRRIILGSALCVGATVAISGPIGFVGLVVPHLLRRWVQQRPGALLVPSALGGAALVLAADISLRLLPTPQELQLGVVTALIGAPFFLMLVVRTRREL